MTDSSVPQPLVSLISLSLWIAFAAAATAVALWRSRLRRSGVRLRASLTSRRRWPLIFVLFSCAAGALEAQAPAIASVSIAPDERGTLVATVGGVPAHHPSRVLVRFRNGARADFIPGSGPARPLLGGRNLYLVPNPPGLGVAAAVRRYRSNPNVLYSEPDYVVQVTDTIPRDPLWSQQWDMTRISAPAAWDTHSDSGGVVVAVIDTGIDSTHPDLRSNSWVNPQDGGHGFTCMNGNCTSGGADDHGHGSHVAGTIGAVADNGTGMAGINWRVQLLSLKFLGANGSGYISDSVLCFDKVAALKEQGINIRVTNNSWGGGGFSQALKDAMSAAEAMGIVHVCAAGNSGVNADVAPMYPAAYDGRGIVSVLASDANDLGAGFSNYGLATVDIAAPGVNTLSTVPAGACALCDASGYKLLSGTSMAAPHVAGVLAALLQRHPTLSAAQARDAVLDPASYDALTDPKAQSTSTGGRLNFAKALWNPLLANPELNNFPALSVGPDVFALAGSPVSLAVTASDPDGDPLRTGWVKSVSRSSQWLFGWMLSALFPDATGSSSSFPAPSLARTATVPYDVSITDGRGGGAQGRKHVTVSPAASPGAPPAGNLTVSSVAPAAGSTITVSFPASDPEGGQVAWDLWVNGNSSASGWCCFTGSSTTVTLSSAGVYRISAQAIDRELQLSARSSVVVKAGGATGEPPAAAATLDRLSGAAPLTVNIDMSASHDPDGSIQSYITYCDWAKGGVAYSGVASSCTYDTPGTYWIMLQVADADGLIDLLPAYVVVTPPASGGSKQPASVTLSKLTQTYTGSPLIPEATTNPPGLAITWTNAPQTNAGSYTVTATVNDPNYTGSAGGTFTLDKAAASVVLSNLVQTYTGAPLTPTASTTPPGLAIVWTNAPQIDVGSHAVTATVNDPNYQGSASGTFTIEPAPVSTPPNVTITSPAGGSVPAKKKVSVQASANKGTHPITRVDFLVNGGLLCSDAGAPYACSWSVPGALGKVYRLQAKAYDAAGQAGESGIVSVTSSR